MIKKYFAALCATALIGVAPYALAAPADLTVTGIITPMACTPTLSEGGIVDHGKFLSTNLNQDSNTKLTDKILQFSVNCDSPIAFRLKPIDNRPGSNINNNGLFGLGFINGNQKLGYFSADFLAPMADGAGVRPMYSYNNGDSWGNFTGLLSNALTAFGAVGGPNTPIAIKHLVSDLRISTYIARADSLDLTNEAALDGSITIQVDYP
jgi:hypothetical protein